MAKPLAQIWRYTQTVLGVLFRHPVTGVSIIPLLPNGEIVLVRRRDNGRWSVPGGLIDWGDDIASTVKRELLEETGLELIAICRLVGVYSAPDRDPRMHSICVVVEATVQGNMQIHDTLEIIEARAFAPELIPLSELSHDHAHQLKNYFRGEVTLA